MVDPSTLLVINGPAGAGKSTVASLLVAGRPASAVVRGDDLKSFVVTKPDDAGASRVSYRSGAAVCTEFLNSGFRFVVFDFIFSNAEHVSEFWSHVRPAVAFDRFFITLWARDETLLARRRARQEDGRYVALMRDSRRRLAERLGELGPTLDTDDLAVEDVAARVSALMAAQGAAARGRSSPTAS